MDVLGNKEHDDRYSDEAFEDFYKVFDPEEVGFVTKATMVTWLKGFIEVI